MTITVYDYDNKEVQIDLPIKSADEILRIFVSVISGDETGFIELKNLEMIHFDSSDCRYIGYDDGDYCLDDPEQIKKWLEFNPPKNRTASYARQELFY